MLHCNQLQIRLMLVTCWWIIVCYVPPWKWQGATFLFALREELLIDSHSPVKACGVLPADFGAKSAPAITGKTIVAKMIIFVAIHNEAKNFLNHSAIQKVSSWNWNWQSFASKSVRCPPGGFPSQVRARNYRKNHCGQNDNFRGYPQWGQNFSES